MAELTTVSSHSDYNHSGYTATGPLEETEPGYETFTYEYDEGASDVTTFIEGVGVSWTKSYATTGTESQTCSEYMIVIETWHDHSYSKHTTSVVSGEAGSAICLLKDPDGTFWVAAYDKGNISGTQSIDIEKTFTHHCVWPLGGDYEYYENFTQNDYTDNTTTEDTIVYLNINNIVIYEYPENTILTPCMCKIGDKYAVIWGVYLPVDKTLQYFLWFDGEVTESDIYPCVEEDNRHEIPDLTFDPDNIYGVGWARIGTITQSGLKEE